MEVLQGNDITPGNLQPVKLSGGVDGEFCRLTLRATIDEGDQIYETGIHIRIQSK